MMNKLTHFQRLIAVAVCASLLASTQANAQIVGDSVNASNTFENPDFTSSVETIFQVGSATVTDPVGEFSTFAGIYDIDFSETSMTMTLASNDGLSFLEYEAGTFDRYYFGFDSNFVDSVAVSGGDTELTNGLTVGLLASDFQLDVADLFGTGIPLPRQYPTGGFFLEFGEGTNLETLGRSVTFDFTTTSVPEPSSAAIFGLAGILVFSRRRRN